MATNEAAAEFPQLPRRTCPMCGESLSLAAKTCGACGETLGDTVSRKTAELAGIGGWLVLPAIGAVISPLLYLYHGGDALLSAADDTIRIEDGVRTVLGFAGFMLSVLGLFSIFVAVMFFQKKRIAPKLMIARFVADMGVNWLVVAFVMAAAAGNAALSAAALGDAVRSTIVGGIWIAYFVQSVRVKNTFVN